MSKLSDLRHALGCTENEIRVILFLSVTLVVGTGIRWIRPAAPPAPPSFDYARSDSEFAARSAAPGSAAADEAPFPSPPRAPALTPRGMNINTATAAELDRLPGIGPAFAERIVLDRDENGPFGTVDDLVRVKGIGPKKLEKIRPFVTVNALH